MTSIFEGLQKEKNVEIDIGTEEPLVVTIRALPVGFVANLDENDPDAEFRVILESIQDNHPNETLDTIKSMPVYVMARLQEEITTFNRLDETLQVTEQENDERQ